jgi:hypothetical protein
MYTLRKVRTIRGCLEGLSLIVTMIRKKQDGPSRSWPTPHTTPFFPPPRRPLSGPTPQTPTRNGDPTPPPPGGRGSLRRGRGTGVEDGPLADADALRHPRHSATA